MSIAQHRLRRGRPRFQRSSQRPARAGRRAHHRHRSHAGERDRSQYRRFQPAGAGLRARTSAGSGRAGCVVFAAADEEEPPRVAAARDRADPRIRSAWRDIIFAETSTLGLRIYAAERRVEERRIVEVETPCGKVRVKVSGHGACMRRNTRIAARSRDRTGTPLQASDRRRAGSLSRKITK